MACSTCGYATRDGARFCGNCGAQLAATVTSTPAAAGPLTAATGLLPPPPPPGTPPTAAFAVATPLIRPLVPPPPPPAAPPAVASTDLKDQPEQQHEGEPEIDETRVSVRRQAKPVWRLVFPDGTQSEVGAALLIGRDAAPNPRWSNAALLSIVDPALSVSKTHAVFEVEDDTLWVTDLHSRNGVVIIDQDRSEVDLEAGQRAEVPAGADIELGDYLIQVERS
jgi:RNA polymerase subunit RPABC4/transcription elongation factor Spt4